MLTALYHAKDLRNLACSLKRQGWPWVTQGLTTWLFSNRGNVTNVWLMHRDSPNENNTFSFPNSSLATVSYVATAAVCERSKQIPQQSLCTFPTLFGSQNENYILYRQHNSKSAHGIWTILLLHQMESSFPFLKKAPLLWAASISSLSDFDWKIPTAGQEVLQQYCSVPDWPYLSQVIGRQW